MAKCPHRFKIADIVADIVAKDHTISTIIKHLSLSEAVEILIPGPDENGLVSPIFTCTLAMDHGLWHTSGGGGEGHYLYGQPLQLSHKRIHN